MKSHIIALAAIGFSGTALAGDGPKAMTDAEMDAVTAGGDAGFDLKIPGLGPEGSGYVEKDWAGTYACKDGGNTPQVYKGFQGWDHREGGIQPTEPDWRR